MVVRGTEDDDPSLIFHDSALVYGIDDISSCSSVNSWCKSGPEDHPLIFVTLIFNFASLFQLVLKISAKENIKRLTDVERPKIEPKAHITNHILVHNNHVSRKKIGTYIRVFYFWKFWVRFILSTVKVGISNKGVFIIYYFQICNTFFFFCNH